MTSSSVEFLNEAFAKAMSLPESFYPEFLQYSKDSYEQSTGNKPQDKRQRKWDDEDFNESVQLSDSENVSSMDLGEPQENKSYVKTLLWVVHHTKSHL
jgi:hypothetical protein